MMVDDVWHSQSKPVNRPPSIYQALLQSAGGQQEDSAYLGSQRSLKHSGSNLSKQTPHSISKMNITEMKQSL